MDEGTPDQPIGRLAGRAARGVLVTGSTQLARIGLQLLSVVVLARLLTPDDYGLISMVIAVIGVGEIFRDFGLSTAAIQAKELTERQRDNLMWINIGLGVVLCGVTNLLAPGISLLFQRVELVPLTQVLSISFILTGAVTQYRASLVRELRFKALGVAEVTSTALALGIGVQMAVNQFGYWALAGQQIASGLIALILYAATCKWLPRRYDPRTSVRPLIKFGLAHLGSQIINYVGNNIDTVLIGLRFGAPQLGGYNRAFQSIMVPLRQIQAPINTVALPILSRLDDEATYTHFVRRAQIALCYPIFAALGLIIVLGEQFVQALLGPQWMDFVLTMQLLAVAGALATISSVGYWIYVTRNLVGALVRYSMASITLKIVCIIVGSMAGPTGVAAGFAVHAAIAWPFSLWWIGRVSGLQTRSLAVLGWRISGIALAAVMLGVATLNLANGFPTCAPAAAALAFAASWGLSATIPAVRRDYGEMLATLRVFTARH